MARFAPTLRPSFPEVPLNAPLGPAERVRWWVVCGDEGHWRVGLYSPPEGCREDVKELERHDCPEFFLLLEGAMTLLVSDGGKLRDLPLEKEKPVLVTAPHSGYCPDGPYKGLALVVERDAFNTEYRLPEEWR
jgi:hypothetical protein